VDTVRGFLREFNRPDDKIYFLMGADSFLHIAEWKDYTTLLSLCDFIVANRPGSGTELLYRAIPPQLLAQERVRLPRPDKNAKSSSVALRRTTIHLLGTVASQVSATGVRQRILTGKSIHGLVPRDVEDYIKKQELYRVEDVHR
jgi:nicotinate-nucleotide adenylyltransferase